MFSKKFCFVGCQLRGEKAKIEIDESFVFNDNEFPSLSAYLKALYLDLTYVDISTLKSL